MAYGQTCALCGKEGAQTTLLYGKNYAGKAVLVQNKMAERQFAQVREFSVCADCSLAKGKTPRKAWIWYIVTTILIYGCIFISARFMNAADSQLRVLGSILLGCGTLSLFVRWCVGMYLMMQSGAGYAASVFLLFIQIMPIASEISILALRKRINARKRAVTALKPVVQEKFDEIAAQEEDLKKKIEQGEITDEKTIREFRQKESVTEARAQENQNAVKRGNIWYAIGGFAFTLLIFLQGMDAYSGRGYMQLFNSIRLSEGQFYLFIVALLVFDVIALMGAVRKKKS